jgi:hypothetical protein
LEAIRDLGDYMLGQEMIPQVVKLSCGKGMSDEKKIVDVALAGNVN